MLLSFVQQNNNVKILPIFVRSTGDSDGRGLCTDGCTDSGVDGCSDVVVDGIVGSTVDGCSDVVVDGDVVIGDVVFGSGSGIFDCAAVIDGVVVVVFAAVVVVVVVVVDGAAVVDGPVVP